MAPSMLTVIYAVVAYAAGANTNGRAAILAPSIGVVALIVASATRPGPCWRSCPTSPGWPSSSPARGWPASRCGSDVRGRRCSRNAQRRPNATATPARGCGRPGTKPYRQGAARRRGPRDGRDHVQAGVAAHLLDRDPGRRGRAAPRSSTRAGRADRDAAPRSACCAARTRAGASYRRPALAGPGRPASGLRPTRRGVAFAVHAARPGLSPGRAAVYRIVQEALTNVAAPRTRDHGRACASRATPTRCGVEVTRRRRAVRRDGRRRATGCVGHARAGGGCYGGDRRRRAPRPAAASRVTRRLPSLGPQRDPRRSSPTTRRWSARASALILDAQADIEVVGEAADGAEAVARAARQRPDVVLMDIRMPRIGRARRRPRRILRRPRRRRPRARPDDVRPRRVRLRGAARRRERVPAQGRAAEQLVARASGRRGGGDALLAPAVTRRLIARSRARPAPRRGAAATAAPTLTAAGAGGAAAGRPGACPTRRSPRELVSRETTVKTHVGTC